MERRVRLEDFRPIQQPASPTSVIVYSILLVFAVHQLLIYFDYPILSPYELLWNALVYITPSRLLLDASKRRELRANNMSAQTFATKSEALRRAFGMGGSTLLQKLPLLHELPGVDIARRGIMNGSKEISTDAPPGLGNWDNSCYQNSVLQGLASLECVKTFLTPPMSVDVAEVDPDDENTEKSFRTSLAALVSRLNDSSNNGRHLWTPAKLKNMSSWQQQDAQEYFSKIMDEVDKETARSTASKQPLPGLEVAADDEASSTPAMLSEVNETVRNPLEGLLAQRVACTRCGFSDGLSMIPFNCLTLPLGEDLTYDLDECLDEYTQLEPISGVDCAKCTLLHAESQYKQLLPPTPVTEQETNSLSELLTLPPELRALAFKRLESIRQALADDDFSDKTINETCNIPKKAHVFGTKTRQAVIGRAPKSLVVHVNRSVFDELTGIQRKNYASVRYPMVLDLAPWMLGDDAGETSTSSLLTFTADHLRKYTYRLKAVVTHYGRHENGHYICYRQHPVHSTAACDGVDAGGRSDRCLRWWRLSDENVSPVTEEAVLKQSGVFMLFYEREDAVLVSKDRHPQVVACEGVPIPPTAAHEILEAALAVPLPEEDDGLDDELSTNMIEAELIEPEIGENLDEVLTQDTPTLETHPSSELLHESESEATDQEELSTAPPPAKPVQKPPTPPLMRTARGGHASRGDAGGFERGFRVVAAT